MMMLIPLFDSSGANFRIDSSSATKSSKEAAPIKSIGADRAGDLPFAPLHITSGLPFTRPVRLVLICDEGHGVSKRPRRESGRT